MSAHVGAIFVGYTLRLVNKNTNYRLVVGAGDFDVYELETVVDCDLFSYLLNACCNRIISHRSRLCRYVAQKKKWARTHRTTPRCLRASCGLYGKQQVEANWETR